MSLSSSIDFSTVEGRGAEGEEGVINVEVIVEGTEVMMAVAVERAMEDGDEELIVEGIWATWPGSLCPREFGEGSLGILRVS